MPPPPKSPPPEFYGLIGENADFLLVDKPAGLMVHPTRPEPVITLIDLLRRDFPKDTLSLVNRLDRETSGLVLVARTREAASKLGKAMMRREIHKEYNAIVAGPVQGLPSSGLVDAPIGRVGDFEPSEIYLKRAAYPGQTGEKLQPAQTEYRIEKTFHSQNPGESIYLLHVIPHTGRIHQIRVHLAHLGYPVVGDKLYGPTCAYLRFIREGLTDELLRELRLPRHALHACKMRFQWNGQPVEYTCPLPADLEDFLKSLAC
ncbi:MAG: RluA family pseudouridine synthase [Verrucomicrobiae bacterium]|nr:RluA family pseudouridine synthase [Verrucomicrobiae bacterium]